MFPLSDNLVAALDCSSHTFNELLVHYFHLELFIFYNSGKFYFLLFGSILLNSHIRVIEKWA